MDNRSNSCVNTSKIGLCCIIETTTTDTITPIIMRVTKSRIIYHIGSLIHSPLFKQFHKLSVLFILYHKSDVLSIVFHKFFDFFLDYS